MSMLNRLRRLLKIDMPSKSSLKDKQIGNQKSDHETEKDKYDETIPTPKEIYNLKLTVIAITASAAAVIIGYDAGFIGGTVSLESFSSEFGLDKMTEAASAEVSSNVVSLFQAGAFFGSLIFYPVAETLGRKIVLILSGILLTVGAGISLAAKESTGLGPIYASRVITGLGIGGCSGISPIYVSEISPAAVRGMLTGTFEASWQVGGIIGYWINYGVLQNIPNSRKQWLIPFATQLIPSGLFFIGTFFIPESPRFFVNKGKIEAASKNLAYLRNLPDNHPYLIHELDTILKDHEIKTSKLGRGFLAPIRKLFSNKKLVYRLFLSTSLFPMQNGFGINAVTYYSPTVFKSFGISGSNAGLLSTGIFGIIKGAASLFWLFFIVENMGRRKALIWFAFPCSICMWYIGAYIKISNPSKRLAEGDTRQDAGAKAAQALLYIWSFTYGCSWNGTPWVINSEIFSQEIRTATQAINSSSNWFWAFVMGRWTGQALDAIGYKLYFIFATVILVFAGVVFLLYPETKGVPLEAVDYLFEVPAWRARDHAMEKFEVEYELGYFDDSIERSPSVEVVNNNASALDDLAKLALDTGVKDTDNGEVSSR